MLRGFLFKESGSRMNRGHLGVFSMAEVPLLQPNDHSVLGHGQPCLDISVKGGCGCTPRTTVLMGRLEGDPSSPNQTEAASVSSPVQWG